MLRARRNAEALRELGVEAGQTGKRAAWCPWIALFGLAVAVRSLRFGVVSADGEVRFLFGADELYHLRRIWFTVVNFPASLDFDSYVNFPNGAALIWPPLFDWSMAALARATVGAGDQGAVEWVAAWVPPLFGALTVLVAARLARRTFSPTAGWATGLLLAVLPGHFTSSELTQVDHHVAVGLGVTLLVGAAMCLAGPLGPRGWPRGVVATGVASAGTIALWPGSLLHVLVVQCVLVVQMLASREQSTAVARARALSAMQAIAALLLLPFRTGPQFAQFGAFSPLVLSNFQPLWLGSGAALLAIAAGLWRRRRFGAGRTRRIGSAALLAAGGLALAWLSIPSLAPTLTVAAAWFSEGDPFLSQVAEIRPLLYPDGRFDPTIAQVQLGLLVWAYPVAAAGLALRALRSRRAEVMLLVVWSSTFFVMTLAQVRFLDSFSCGYALVMGCALAEGWRATRDRLAPRRRVVAAGAILALVAVELVAILPFHARSVERSVAALRGRPLPEGAFFRQRVVLRRVARWLRSASPPTQGYLDPTRKPEYGVLSAWGHGHLLRYYAERPMVQDNFGSYAGGSGFDLARDYYGSRGEGTALEIARNAGARYVVATPAGSGQGPIEPGSMAALLLQPASHPLSRHRLVFLADDSDLWAGVAGGRPWTALVFEIVPAALVSGHAPGRELVRFTLPLELPGRGTLLYAASAAVDDEGRYRVRLPYASDGPADAYVRAEGSYRVASGEEVHTLAISEADVREGRALEGPSFGP